MHSWRILLLPYLGGQKLHDEYRFDEPWNGPNNSRLHSQMPNVYKFSPKHRTPTTMTNYLAVVGPDTLWQESGKVTYADITDGSGETVHFVECTNSGINWLEPRDLRIDTDPNNGISSWHEPPAVAMADGSVHKLRMDLSEAAVRGMLLLNDGLGASDAEAILDGRERPVKKDVQGNGDGKETGRAK